MKYHVMVDIETLGTGNDALPVSIGAVKFTKTDILGKFEVGIDPEDAQRYGRKLDAGTIMWWFKPENAEARQVLLDMPKIDLHSALQGFGDWCAMPTTEKVPEGTIPFGNEPLLELGSLWGNGATFDNIILRSAVAATGAGWPFSFRQDECFRTLKNRAPDITHEFVGTKHSAVDDALNQALHLQKICAAKGLEL